MIVYKESLKTHQIAILKGAVAASMRNRKPVTNPTNRLINFFEFRKLQNLYKKLYKAGERIRGNGRTQITLSLTEEEAEAVMLINELNQADAVINHFKDLVQQAIYNHVDRLINIEEAKKQSEFHF